MHGFALSQVSQGARFLHLGGREELLVSLKCCLQNIS